MGPKLSTFLLFHLNYVQQISDILPNTCSLAHYFSSYYCLILFENKYWTIVKYKNTLLSAIMLGLYLSKSNSIIIILYYINLWNIYFIELPNPISASFVIVLIINHLLPMCSTTYARFNLSICSIVVFIIVYNFKYLVNYICDTFNLISLYSECTNA